MTDILEQKAEKLARRPYRFKLEKDEVADGEFVFLARVVEMPTCMAQGGTPDEAQRELREVMFEFILSMLEDGEPVPVPRLENSVTAGYMSLGVTIEATTYGTEGFSDDLSDATRPKDRESLGEGAWVHSA